MASQLTSALPRVTALVTEITQQLLFIFIWNKIPFSSFQTGLVFVIFSAAPKYIYIYILPSSFGKTQERLIQGHAPLWGGLYIEDVQSVHLSISIDPQTGKQDPLI